MGEYGDKLLLEVESGGMPILAHVIQTAEILARQVHIAYAHEKVKDVVSAYLNWQEDEMNWHLDKGQASGPFQAIADVFAVMDMAEVDTVLVIAGDLPGIDSSVLYRLRENLLSSDAEAAVAVRDGRLQPLVAAYRPIVNAKLSLLVQTGEKRLMTLMETLKVVPVEFGVEAGWRIRPVHTPQDYDAWLAWRGELEKS